MVRDESVDDPAGKSPEENPGQEWENWSGSVSFRPARIVSPTSEEALRSLIRRCRDQGRTVRVAGSGHSWTPVVETDDVLVTLDRLTGVVSHDPDAKTATVLGGTTLDEVGSALNERNLGMPNLGDVSLQTVAGAVCTGTHGTGPAFENLSGSLIGGRMVTGTGEIREFHADEDHDFLRAARLSLGTLGIFTELELDLQPTYKLQRREYCTRWDACQDDIFDLIAENRNFDFYWYPRSNEVKLRLLNAPGGGTDHDDLSYATKVKDKTGWWHEILPVHDDIGREFNEMEYAVPLENGLECFERVRERVTDRWRSDVGWRLLVRTVAEDDSYLSTEHGRDVMTISLIQNAQLDHREYFEDIQPIFREYDGRPHWGKIHTLRAPKLRELYPEWDQFQNIRRDVDPDGVFMTDYLRALLESDAERASKGKETIDGTNVGDHG